MALLACMAVLLAGCYTMLRHPSTDDGYEYTDFRSCTQCHERYYHFDPHEPLYSDAWWDYYALPWWYDAVIVSDDEGGVPIRQAIQDMNLKLRDDANVTSPMGVKRKDPSDGIKEKKESGETRGSTDENQTKIREKTATKTKRTSKREKDDGAPDLKRKSDSGDTGLEDEAGTGDETRRDKKRKLQ